MTKLSAPQPARFSYSKHRQDVARQIILPVAFVAVMVVVLAALTVLGFQNGGDVGKWAAIAIIWMILPLMAILLGVVAAAWGFVYLLTRLLQVSPRYTGKLQLYVVRFNTEVILWTDKIIQPILQLKAWLGLFTREEKESEAKSYGQEKPNRYS
jgi:hypothetical protein